MWLLYRTECLLQVWGYSIFFPNSGVVVAECFSPRKLADSSAESELIMASWAGKAIISYRMLHREIFGGVLAPTALELDASAVMGSAVMERVTRSSGSTLRAWRCFGSGLKTTLCTSRRPAVETCARRSFRRLCIQWRSFGSWHSWFSPGVRTEPSCRSEDRATHSRASGGGGLVRFRS